MTRLNDLLADEPAAAPSAQPMRLSDAIAPPAEPMRLSDAIASPHSSPMRLSDALMPAAPPMPAPIIPIASSSQSSEESMQDYSREQLAGMPSLRQRLSSVLESEPKSGVLMNAQGVDPVTLRPPDATTMGNLINPPADIITNKFLKVAHALAEQNIPARIGAAGLGLTAPAPDAQITAEHQQYRDIYSEQEKSAAERTTSPIIRAGAEFAGNVAPPIVGGLAGGPAGLAAGAAATGLMSQGETFDAVERELRPKYGDAKARELAGHVANLSGAITTAAALFAPGDVPLHKAFVADALIGYAQAMGGQAAESAVLGENRFDQGAALKQAGAQALGGTVIRAVGKGIGALRETPQTTSITPKPLSEVTGADGGKTIWARAELGIPADAPIDVDSVHANYRRQAIKPQYNPNVSENADRFGRLTAARDILLGKSTRIPQPSQEQSTASAQPQPPVEPKVEPVTPQNQSKEGEVTGRQTVAETPVAPVKNMEPVQPVRLSEATQPPTAKEWTLFPPQSGSLGVPRADMPQVKAEHRGALVNFLKGKGIESESAEMPPGQLKPTQAEYSNEKVQKARDFEGGQRSIIVSSDNYVVDGHHQWVAALQDQPSEPIKVIKVDAPIRDLLPVVKEFPSAGQSPATQPPSASSGASAGQGEGSVSRSISPKAGIAVQQQSIQAGTGQKSKRESQEIPSADVPAKQGSRTEIALSTPSVPSSPQPQAEQATVSLGNQTSLTPLVEVSPSHELLSGHADRPQSPVASPAPKDISPTISAPIPSPSQSALSTRTLTSDVSPSAGPSVSRPSATAASPNLPALVSSSTSAAPAGPQSYRLSQPEYKKLKRFLNNAIKSNDVNKVIAVAEVALKRFDEVGHPDDWSNWQRALDDANFQKQRGRTTMTDKSLPGAIPAEKEASTPTPVAEKPTEVEQSAPDRGIIKGQETDVVPQPQDTSEVDQAGNAIAEPAATQASAPTQQAGGTPSESGRGAVPDRDGGDTDRGNTPAQRDAETTPTRREPVENPVRTEASGSGTSPGDATPAPRGPDYIAEPGALARTGSWREAAQRNLDIIKLVKQLIVEQRQATLDEQKLLSKYTGFGASELANSLFPVDQRTGEINTYRIPENYRPIYDGLVEALTPEEFKTLTRSTQYAHYTSEAVIRSIWDGVRRLGFEGGKIMEPGAGIGLFMVAAPREIISASKYVGVEMDHLTADIARQLLPQQTIIKNSFIEQRFPDGLFDASFGNPPFSGMRVLADPRYKKYGFKLHDFFFAKTLDSTRPGGLLVFVTSKGTMDKLDGKARTYIAERADLLGAIRLPQTAFKQNAGTEVVTDILFLQRRPVGQEAKGSAWMGQKEVETAEGQTNINEYFVDHPEMVLGTHAMQGTMYRADSYTLLPRESGTIEEHLAKAIQNLPEKVYKPIDPHVRTQQVQEVAARQDFNVKHHKEGGLYLAEDGQLMQVSSGVGESFAKSLKPAERDWLTDYVPLRDSIKQALHDQLTDGDWQGSQKRLVKLYRKFVKRHGRVLAHTNVERMMKNADGEEEKRVYRKYKWNRLLSSTVDTEMSLIESLEKTNDEDTSIEDGDILTKRVLAKPEPPQIKTVSDALAVSLNNIGKLDIPDVAKLMKIDERQAIESLGDQIYEDPSYGWQLADAYLSGDVVRKLEEAQAAANVDPRYNRNVKALIKAQPAPLGPERIEVRLGANWVPPEDVTRFANEIAGVGGQISYEPRTNTWTVPSSRTRSARAAGDKFGTADRSPAEILNSVLNNQSLTIKRSERGPPSRTWVDQEATTLVNQKADDMREAFANWLWTDSERTPRLLNLYNRKLNNIAERKFDGSHLTLPGLSLRFKLHPHQLRTVWRQIQTGDTYLAHAVGAGKTLEMVVGAMEQKRLGLIRKPMFVVPNHMVEQFANEFQQAYPAARLLVADEENFVGDERRRFVAKAAMNDWDGIIFKHSSFKLLGITEETAKSVGDDILDELRAALDDTDESDRFTRKRLEAQIEAIEQKIAASLSSKDKNLTFEQLGVDMLYVDEAHVYRKLDYATSRQVKGIDPNGSGYAFDLFAKARWLHKQRPGRSIVLASGTPITNTLAEMFTVQRYMNYDGLRNDNMQAFDAWANMFGVAKAEYELDASGEFQKVDRFQYFINVPELMSRVRQFMDVLTMEELGELVTRPEQIGGKPELIETAPNDSLMDFMQGEIKSRLEASRKWKPSYSQPNNPDPIIAINTDARLAAIDMRFINPKLPSDPNSKLNKMIDGIISTYKATKDNVYTTEGEPDPLNGGAQIVFSMAGLGGQVAITRGFDAKAWIVQRLKKAGIPSAQIAFMEDYAKAAQKEAMFKEMRNGAKRILIGTPKNMGTGVNVQKRLTELHYLAPPWYPADVAQPEGRILRQGNQNKKIKQNWYVTTGTYDATMWGMVRRKARAIEQAMRGDKNVRRIEDISEVSQYAMAEAIASGDPRMMQLAELASKNEKLTRLRNAHFSEQREVEYQLHQAQQSRKFSVERRDMARAQAKAIGTETYDPTIIINGNEPETQTAKGEAILNLATSAPVKPVQIGTVGGVPLTIEKYGASGKVALNLKLPGASPYQIGVYDPMQDGPMKIGRALERALYGPSEDVSAAEANIAQYDDEIKSLSSKKGTPFPQAAELERSITEHAQLNRDLIASSVARQEAAKQRKESPPATPEPSPQLSIGESPESLSAIGKKGSGIPKSQVASAIAPMRAEFPNIKITIVQSEAELPPNLQRLVERYKAQGRVKAAVDDASRVFVVADNVSGEDEAIQSAFHEIVGHIGVDATLGDLDKGRILDFVGRNDPELMAGVQRDYPEADHIPEAIARLSQKFAGKAKPKWYQRILNWIRYAWRRFTGKLFDYGDVEQVMLKARERAASVEAGKSEPAANIEPIASDSGASVPQTTGDTSESLPAPAAQAGEDIFNAGTVDTPPGQPKTQPLNLSGGRSAGAIMLPTKADFAEAGRYIGQKINHVQDFLDISGTPRLAREKLADLAASHAFAPSASPFLARDLTARVFGPEGIKDEALMQKTQRVMNLDNLLGIYDSLRSRATAMDNAVVGLKAKIKTLQRQRRQVQGLAKGVFSKQIRKAKKMIGLAKRAARRHRRDAQQIDKVQDISATSLEVMAAQADPRIVAAIENWKKYVMPKATGYYNELAGRNPNDPRPTRGRVFGARVNLLAIDKKTGMPHRPIKGVDIPPERPPSATGGGRTTNPYVKRDPYARKASGLGTYSENPEQVLTHMLHKRWGEVTKLRFINGLIKRGVAVLPARKLVNGKMLQAAPPTEIGGKPVQTLAVKLPRVTKSGGTEMEERTLYIRGDLLREVRDVLNTDLNEPSAWYFRVATGLQMASGVDLVSHLFNQWRLASNALGHSNAMKDILARLPGMGGAAGAWDMARTFNEVLHDEPTVRADLAEMARKGYIRPDFPATGISRITGSQKLIHRFDTAIRLILLRRFRNLVARGLPKGGPNEERKFVAQLGVYNGRLLGPLSRTARNAGFSPFIVAGKNFNRQSRRYMTGSPGFTPQNWKASLQARLIQMTLPIAGLATAALVNYLITGDANGRSGVPIGAIDTGKDDEQGRHVIYDLIHIEGIRRGMRSLGLDALIEGIRQGKDANTIAGNMESQAVQNALHPIMGPGPAFIFKGLTGMQPDIRGTMEARSIPAGGIAQTTENFRAAMESQNSLWYELGKISWDLIAHGKLPEGESGMKMLAGAGGRAIVSSMGIKSVNPGSNAAEDLAQKYVRLHYANRGFTEEEEATYQVKQDVLNAFRRGKSQGEQAIEDAIDGGSITERQGANLEAKAGMSRLAWNVRQITPEQGVEVYNLAAPEQRPELRDMLAKKILRSDLPAQKQDQLMATASLPLPPNINMIRRAHELRKERNAARETHQPWVGPKDVELRLLERQSGLQKKVDQAAQ